MTGLGLVEMDLLGTHAGAFGRISAERDELFAIAGETLEARGLATAAGPDGPAADLVSALGNRRGTVAIVYGKHAVVCRQTFSADATESLVDVRRLPLGAVGNALTALVPETPGATAMPIQLPSAAAHAAQKLIETAGEEVGYRLHQVIEDHGGNPDKFDALTALLTTTTGSGQRPNRQGHQDRRRSTHYAPTPYAQQRTTCWPSSGDLAERESPRQFSGDVHQRGEEVRIWLTAQFTAGSAVLRTVRRLRCRHASSERPLRAGCLLCVTRLADTLPRYVHELSTRRLVGPGLLPVPA